MRTSKLTLAITLAAVSLTLVSGVATAGARRQNNAGTRVATCRVSLNVAPHLITAGEAVLAFGRLACGGGGGAESAQTVTLYESSVSSPSPSVAGTATTDMHGFYEINVSAVTSNSQFYVIADAAQSGTRNVRVAAQVTLAGPPEGVVPTTLKTGRHNRVTFTGTVSPADAGAAVVLQRQNALTGNGWFPIQRGTFVGPTGSFTIVHTFVVPGPANIRVLVRSNHRNIPSVSNILDYEISQAQNPQLTIHSSADPISYGQTTTISGAVAGAPNTPVELFARSATQLTFAPVKEVKTDGSGNYTFPPQMPLVNTFYRVEGAGKSSAVLFEGVKFVLTAAASATTIPAGQSVTFSGTVTPAESGHVVYLERENVGGTGFHVIQVGILTGSTYSITHTFFGVGTDNVRIKIPGGPVNASTASQLFAIQVAPPTASALTPEAPGNSTQPPEGKI